MLELLTVIAIIAVLLALILPAVQAARESARRVECKSHLKGLGLAIHQYVATFSTFPPGASQGWSEHASLLPFVDQGPLYNRINYDLDPTVPENLPIAANRIDRYLCPSDPAGIMSLPHDVSRYGTNFAGNFGTGMQKSGFNGIFYHIDFEPIVRPIDVRDGLAHTAAMAEILDSDGTGEPRRSVANTEKFRQNLEEFAAACETATARSPNSADVWARGRPWTWGDPLFTKYNHILGPNRPTCTNGTAVQEGAYPPGSLHRGGAHALFADGHVAFIADPIALPVWRAIGSRSGAETVPLIE